MNPPKTYTVDEAQKALERYCAYQDRCHKEVSQKLFDMRMIPEARDQIIVHLIQHDFLNEERYVNSYVRGKFRIKKWGKQRLKLELKRKDIHTSLIKKALDAIDSDTYLETFNELAQKKCDATRETNKQKKRKKLADYLFYRGWESHLVYDKIRELVP
ncbi:MAG: RecX family transcriptional regulator [Algicola sp.]|nr:RecX family transcriptional regulator [Algicola sp.]